MLMPPELHGKCSVAAHHQTWALHLSLHPPSGKKASAGLTYRKCSLAFASAQYRGAYLQCRLGTLHLYQRPGLLLLNLCSSGCKKRAFSQLG